MVVMVTFVYSRRPRGAVSPIKALGPPGALEGDRLQEAEEPVGASEVKEALRPLMEVTVF